VRDIERNRIARRHDVGHVHVARGTPGNDSAATILRGGFIEAADGSARHVARSMRLMVVGGAAAVGRAAGGADIVACKLQQHD
jgi:hypothetical protein